MNIFSQHAGLTYFDRVNFGVVPLPMCMAFTMGAVIRFNSFRGRENLVFLLRAAIKGYEGADFISLLIVVHGAP